MLIKKQNQNTNVYFTSNVQVVEKSWKSKGKKYLSLFENLLLNGNISFE